MSRLLDDTDSFDADATGPTTGDDANGDEIPDMGDPLMRRTRWCGNRLSGAWRVVSYDDEVNTATGEAMDLDGVTSYTIWSGLSFTDPVKEGDVILAHSEIHVQLIGVPGIVELTHSYDLTPFGAPTLTSGAARRFSFAGSDALSLHASYESRFAVVSTMDGYTGLGVLSRVRVVGSGAGAKLFYPSVTRCELWRPNGSL